MRRDNNGLRATLRTLMDNGGGLTTEMAVAELKEFLENNPSKVSTIKFEPVPQVTVPGKSLFNPKHSEIAVLQLGDWHIGERVHPLAMNGMNEHNSLIAAGKLWRIVEKFLRIVRRHEMMYTVDSIWVPVLGDMTSGSIHKELVLTNDLLDIPATVLAANLLIMVVGRLKTLGKKIRLDCVVGNHARTTEKMPTKVQALTSYDWMCYVMVSQYFANDDQVEVVIHQAQHALLEIMGHHIVLEHGYGFSGKNIGQLDSYLRDIFDHKDYRAATGNTGSAVDFVIIGDKHTCSLGERYMINGSLPGSSELTPSWRLKPITAIQQCYGVSKNELPTFYYGLTASHTECQKVDNSFSQYTASFLKSHGR